MAIKALLAPRKKFRVNVKSVVLTSEFRTQSKAVVPGTTVQTVKPDPGFDALSFVTVMGIPYAESETFSATQIDPDIRYSIGYNWFSQVVDRVQTMAGTRRDMTPNAILYWLNMIKFIPQGFADTWFSLDMGSGTAARLPTVTKATARSDFSISMGTSASGQ